MDIYNNVNNISITILDEYIKLTMYYNRKLLNKKYNAYDIIEYIKTEYKIQPIFCFHYNKHRIDMFVNKSQMSAATTFKLALT